MNFPIPAETVSPVRMLLYLRLSIEEAKLVRSIVKSKHLVNRSEIGRKTRRRIARLDRDIEYLEEQVARLDARLDKRRDAASWI